GLEQLHQGGAHGPGTQKGNAYRLHAWDYIGVEAREVLEGYAREQGFLTAWAPLELPQPVRQRYRDWLGQGAHAGMGYL
ncbi:hypothetical protein OFC63_35005, partial [Escherichia coli]|nr:hypothetical protein [Escherichia coli]